MDFPIIALIPEGEGVFSEAAACVGCVAKGPRGFTPFAQQMQGQQIFCKEVKGHRSGLIAASRHGKAPASWLSVFVPKRQPLNLPEWAADGLHKSRGSVERPSHAPRAWAAGGYWAAVKGPSRAPLTVGAGGRHTAVL